MKDVKKTGTAAPASLFSARRDIVVGLFRLVGNNPAEVLFKEFDLVLLGFRGEQRQEVAQEIGAGLFRDDQVILHLLFRRVVADAAVSGGAVVGEGVRCVFVDLLAEAEQFVIVFCVNLKNLSFSGA